MKRVNFFLKRRTHVCYWQRSNKTDYKQGEDNFIWVNKSCYERASIQWVTEWKGHCADPKGLLF